jgi:hypothetical protein
MHTRATKLIPKPETLNQYRLLCLHARTCHCSPEPAEARTSYLVWLSVCVHVYVSPSRTLARASTRALSLYARARCARVWELQGRWAAQQTHQGQVSGMHMRVMSASASSVARTQRPALASILKSPFYVVSFTQ